MNPKNPQNPQEKERQQPGKPQQRPSEKGGQTGGWGQTDKGQGWQK